MIAGGLSRFIQTSIVISAAIHCSAAASHAADFGQQLFKLTAADAAAEDFFGNAVAIDGHLGIVGALQDDFGFDENAGAAYLFDTRTGEQLRKLTPSDPDFQDLFGGSVGISNGIAIVGARFNDDIETASGSAYLFDANSGNQLFKLTASDPVPFGQFGESVSISGSHALVGAPGYNTSAGAAYLFDVATGQELRKLALPDAAAGDLFGDSVAINGNLAVIGAPTRRVSATASGAAYVMDVNTGQELFNLMPADAEYTALGNAVALHGNFAIVGAYLTSGAGSLAGAAYVFDVTTGQQLYKLTPADAAVGDLFGYSVATNDKFAVVSAHRDISDTNPGIGSVYAIQWTTTDLGSRSRLAKRSCLWAPTATTLRSSKQDQLMCFPSCRNHRPAFCSS
jgi:outer membrane protein assembly factor BamB